MRTALIFGGLLAALTSGPARAVENYDDCDAFVTGPAYNAGGGVLCLNQDIIDPAGSGQTIRLSSLDTTLDCKHHRLVGAPGAVAVRMELNYGYLVVRNCDIRGYSTGIEIIHGTGVRIENNRIEGATETGIHVNAAHSVIRGNVVLDTGGADAQGVIAGIKGAGGVHIIDNVVSGIQAGAPGSTVIGIRTLSNGAGSVVGNQVSGLVPATAAAAYGIYNSDSGFITLEGNHVRNLARGGTGILCTDADATAARNIVSGFDTGIANCLSVVNTVN